MSHHPNKVTCNRRARPCGTRSPASDDALLVEQAVLSLLDHWGSVWRQRGYAALSDLALDGFRNASDAMRAESRTIREAASTENASAPVSARARQKGVRLRVQWLARWMMPTLSRPSSMSWTASAASRTPKIFSVTSMRLSSR